MVQTRSNERLSIIIASFLGAGSVMLHAGDAWSASQVLAENDRLLCQTQAQAAWGTSHDFDKLWSTYDKCVAEHETHGIVAVALNSACDPSASDAIAPDCVAAVMGIWTGKELKPGLLPPSSKKELQELMKLVNEYGATIQTLDAKDGGWQQKTIESYDFSKQNSEILKSPILVDPTGALKYNFNLSPAQQ